MGKMYLYHTSDVLWFSVAYFWCQSFGDIDSNSNVSKYLLLKRGPSRGFGGLGRRAIYFQGAGEQC